MKLKLILGLIFAVCLVAPRADAQKLAVGSKPPTIKVGGWAKGTPVTKLAKSKLYVVEFWATWCGPCKMSIPKLTALAKKYAGKVTVVGVSVWEQGKDTPGQVKKFVAGEGPQMNYHVAYDTANGLMAKTWMTAAGADSIPTAFIVKNGKVVWMGNPLQGIDEAMNEIIAGNYTPARAAAVTAAREKEETEAFKAFTDTFQVTVKAKQYTQALGLADRYASKHPDQAQSLDLMRAEALMDMDPKKGYAYIDAHGPNNPILYLVFVKALSEGDGEDFPLDPPKAVELAKRFDASDQGNNFYSKSLLVMAYKADGKRTLAMTAANEGLSLAIKQGADQSIIAGLRQYVTHFGLDDRLPGDPPSPITVGGWIGGGPVDGFDPNKVYVVDFMEADRTAWTKDRLEHLSMLASKYEGRVVPMGILSGYDPSGTGNRAKKLVAELGDRINFPVAFDTDAEKMWGVWVGDYHVVPLRTFIVSGGRLVWCGAFTDKIDEALGQVLAGRFDLEASKADFAAAIEEAALIYSMGKEPSRVLFLLDDFVTMYPRHADDSTIGMMKVLALLKLSKARAMAYIDSDGPKCDAIYCEAARDLLSGAVGIQSDPGLALAYAKRAADAEAGKFWSTGKLLGDAYLANGQKDLAKAAYRDALQRARAENDAGPEIDKLAELAK